MRLYFAAVLVAAILIVATDAYIIWDINRSVVRRSRKLWLSVYGVFTLLCWALVLAVLLYPMRDPEVSIVPEMWMLLTVISIYIPKVVYCLGSLIGRLFKLGRKRRNRPNYGAIVGAAIGVAIFIWIWIGALFTRNQIVTNEVQISSAKLPESFDGLRVMQFSDAHLGTWGNDTTFISQMVDSINSRKPDLILFTGDIVSRRSNELDPFVKVLGRLKAPLGVYAVHGNHDYSSYVDWDDKDPGFANRDVARLDSLMRGMGWKVLNNAADFITLGNDSISVIGVENWGEPPFNQLGDLKIAYCDGKSGANSLTDNKFKILLTHNPMHWSEVVTKVSDIDLTLSGHTHAMQMIIGSGRYKWSPSQYKYGPWAGRYDTTSPDGKPMTLYVNIGVGEVGYPTRLGSAKPELTLFTLRRDTAQNLQAR